jgi:hypothetical protein
LGKRSNYERRIEDAYPTPFKAVVPAIPHFKADMIYTFVEPCAGDGALVQHLKQFGMHCAFAADLSADFDALNVERDWFRKLAAQAIITNPPWRRPTMHALIEAFLKVSPLVWLLIDADWAHTAQSGPYMAACTKIVPIGRVQWIPESGANGKDNVCWYRFARGFRGKTEFVPRLEAA